MGNLGIHMHYKCMLRLIKGIYQPRHKIRLIMDK